MNSEIRDLSLAPFGARKIEWVERNCDLLRTLRTEFQETLPFRGLRIALSVHLEAKTAFLCKVLQAGGAEMFVTGSNPLSTQDDVAAALVHEGLNVFAVHGATPDEYERGIRKVIEAGPNIKNYNKYKVPVVITGKNIYNIELYPLSNSTLIYATTGKVSTGGPWQATVDYIPIREYAGKTIVLNKRPGGNGPGIAYYNENYVFISGTLNANVPAGTPMVSTIPENAVYMRFTVPTLAKEIQIELGENSTSYEGYNELIKNIYLDSPIYENESISLSDTHIKIPTIKGTNILTVDTTVRPSKVLINI